MLEILNRSLNKVQWVDNCMVYTLETSLILTASLVHMCMVYLLQILDLCLNTAALSRQLGGIHGADTLNLNKASTSRQLCDRNTEDDLYFNKTSLNGLSLYH